MSQERGGALWRPVWSGSSGGWGCCHEKPFILCVCCRSTWVTCARPAPPSCTAGRCCSTTCRYPSPFPLWLPGMPNPGSTSILLCSISTSLSSRTKMGMVSPQLLPPEFSGHPQLLLLPPPPPPSSPLLTQRLRSSEPYMWSSMASSRSLAGPWRPCATSPRTSARSCWTR